MLAKFKKLAGKICVSRQNDSKFKIIFKHLIIKPNLYYF